MGIFISPMRGSHVFSLSKADVWSLTRGLLISAGAAVLAYLVTDVVPQLEAAAMTPQAAFAVTVLANLLNIVQRFLRDTR